VVTEVVTVLHSRETLTQRDVAAQETGSFLLVVTLVSLSEAATLDCGREVDQVI
jgi:hypothetical protein